MEHGVPVVQQVDVQETVGLPDGLQVALRQQRRELFQQAVLLQLVPQAPDHEELGVHPDGVAYEAQLLGADPVFLCKRGESAKSSTRIKMW